MAEKKQAGKKKVKKESKLNPSKTSAKTRKKVATNNISIEEQVAKAIGQNINKDIRPKKKQSISQIIFHWLIKLYLVSVLYFLVVYHLEYFKAHGFHDWVLFGLIFATVKAVFWPAMYWKEVLLFFNIK